MHVLDGVVQRSGTMIVVWPYYQWVAVAQVPHLIWVSLATVLQLSITWMNWGKGT